MPLIQVLSNMIIKHKPKLKERSATAERLIQKVTHYVDTFISGVGL